MPADTDEAALAAAEGERSEKHGLVHLPQEWRRAPSHLGRERARGLRVTDLRMRELRDPFGEPAGYSSKNISGVFKIARPPPARCGQAGPALRPQTVAARRARDDEDQRVGGFRRERMKKRLSSKSIPRACPPERTPGEALSANFHCRARGGQAREDGREEAVRHRTAAALAGPVEALRGQIA